LGGIENSSGLTFAQFPQIEPLPFVIYLDEFAPSDQDLQDRPISFGSRQELVESVLSDRVHGRVTQKVFFDVTCESEMFHR
jgi:hypothetical protein